MSQYRNEWKYCCTEGALSLLENRLKALLRLDPHIGPAGKYTVRSLYFDDYRNTCAAENEAGVAKRFKYRIRYYDSASDQLHLERKEKWNDRCRKRSCPLTQAQYDALVSGDVSELLHNTDDPLLKRFCLDIMTRHFTPKAVICYERIAFVEPITNIRVTFDTNISVSPEVDAFLTGEHLCYPLLPDRLHILEVKFDDILPGFIRNTVCSADFQQSAFSKYYLGRKKIEEVRK